MAATAISATVFARCGMMGNPSDGFEGKTISFLIKNFGATCTLEPNDGPEVEVVANPQFDKTSHSSMEGLFEHTGINGYYGGLRLLQATLRTFFSCLKNKGLEAKQSKGFKLSYDTTIPRCVGLSGSSAIIVAAFRCLMKHFDTSLEALGIAQDVFPSLILNIEKNELKISAGLQDRVIQTYGGLVHMDFSSSPVVPVVSDENCTDSSDRDKDTDHINLNPTLDSYGAPGGVYKALDADLLRPHGLYLVCEYVGVMFVCVELSVDISVLLLSCSITTGASGSPGLLPSCSITITISLHITTILTMALMSFYIYIYIYRPTTPRLVATLAWCTLP